MPYGCMRSVRNAELPNYIMPIEVNLLTGAKMTMALITMHKMYPASPKRRRGIAEWPNDAYLKITPLRSAEGISLGSTWSDFTQSDLHSADEYQSNLQINVWIPEQVPVTPLLHSTAQQQLTNVWRISN